LTQYGLSPHPSLLMVVEGATELLLILHRTSAVRESLGRLVDIDNWRSNGLSFEFAHFTDKQLAAAIATINDSVAQIPVAQLVSHVRAVRDSGGNIASLLGRRSKIDLADTLWPALEGKIRAAEQRGTQACIPIVRVLDRATGLAREIPRRNIVIPLRPDA
jgi:hypothetical protein